MVTVSPVRTLAEVFDQLESYGATGETDARARTRGRLLREATALFQSRGYRHTSIDDVARAAGVAKGTVYVHFRNKAELLLHAVAEEKKRYLERSRALLDPRLTPEQRLEGYLEMALLAVPEAPLVCRLMTGDRELYIALEELAPDLREMVERTQAEGMELVLKGVGGFDRLSSQERADRAKVLSAILANAVELMDPRVRKGLAARRYAQLVARVLVHGLGAP